MAALRHHASFTRSHTDAGSPKCREGTAGERIAGELCFEFKQVAEGRWDNQEPARCTGVVSQGEALV